MGKLMMLRNYKTVVLLSFLLKRKSCCRFFYIKLPVRRFFFCFSVKKQRKYFVIIKIEFIFVAK